MKPHFGMPLDPSGYARKLVTDLGFSEPTVEWVDVVLDYLGLKKRRYPGYEFFSSGVDAETTTSDERQARLLDIEPDCPTSSCRLQRRPVDAALLRKTIFVDVDSPLERQRLATCHEVGHFYLPWHEGLTYVKDNCIVGFPEQYELEASRFAADLLMPPPFFREDMEGLPFGLKSVESLSRRYLTSLEATARHYVHLSRKSCALVVIEALPKKAASQDGSWLRVRYCTRSSSFDHFIRPKTPIETVDTPIAQASLPTSSTTIVGSRPVIVDEVSGRVLGLRPERRLILHCRSWGKAGDVLVLVEERQGNQGKLF